MFRAIRTAVVSRFERAVLGVLAAKTDLGEDRLKTALETILARELAEQTDSKLELTLRRIVEQRLNERSQTNFWAGFVVTVVVIPLAYFAVTNAATNRVDTVAAPYLQRATSYWDEVFKSVMQKAAADAVETATALEAAQEAREKAKEASSTVSSAMSIAEEAARDSTASAKQLDDVLDELAKARKALPEVRGAATEASSAAEEARKAAQKASDFLQTGAADLAIELTNDPTVRSAILEAVNAQQGPSGPRGEKGDKGEDGKRGPMGPPGQAAPVGAIVAWPADLTIAPDGWLECNGAELSSTLYPELAELLKSRYGEARPGYFRVPDYRGLFLRGAGRASRGPGAAADIQSRSGDKEVGSEQGFATAQPSRSFKTRRGGEHSHQIHKRDNQTNRGGHGYGLTGHPQYENVRGDGSHVHAIVGGDLETRPINIAVHWLIRVR